MKHFRKLLVLVMTAVFTAAMGFPSSAAPAPVECSWGDLHIDATGYLSWSMTLPEEYKSLKVQKYTIKMDIMTSGIWREDFRTYNTVETSKEIYYGTVGIYRFRVMATFVGGLVSNVSGYSNECSVTSDYINQDDPGQGGGYGPGNPGGYGPGNPGGYGPGQSGGYGPGNPGPGTQNPAGAIPDWVEKTGQWSQSNGQWYYSNNGTLYKNKWACVFNPYARTGLGQRSYDWFCFDETGAMRTGWYMDGSGRIFYLSPVSDGSKGKMVTGWQLIDGYWYYFNTQEGSGNMGALLTDTVVDGHFVDSAGRRVS